MKLHASSKASVYLLGFFSGFCFSVLLSYVTLTSVKKSPVHRQYHESINLTHSHVEYRIGTPVRRQHDMPANPTYAHVESRLGTTSEDKPANMTHVHVESGLGTTSYQRTVPKLVSTHKLEPSSSQKTLPVLHNGTALATLPISPPQLEAPLARYVKHVHFHSRYVQCDRIFNGESDEISRVKSYLQNHTHSFPEGTFINMTKDCGVFRKERGYIRNYSKEELDFPLAFGLLTHENFEQVERLLRTIYAPHNVYCIHVDSKSPQQFINAVRSLTKCFPNVFVASRLENVTYAHFSRLRADINCIEDLLNRTKTWTYYLNMASSEIPLKTNLWIIRYLKKINGSNDIAESVKRRIPMRYIYRYAVWGGKMHRTRFLLPPPPHNLTIAKGQAYGAFSRKFLEFTLTNKIARDLLNWSKDTYSPDEHYWATLNNLYHNPFLNSPGGSKSVPERTRYNGRFVKWYMKEGYCKGVIRHNLCVYGVGDLPDLKNINKLVANKFDVNFDPFAVACMEEHLKNMTLAEGK